MPWSLLGEQEKEAGRYCREMLFHCWSVLHVYPEPTGWNFRLAICSGLTLEFFLVADSSVLFHLFNSLYSFFGSAAFPNGMRRNWIIFLNHGTDVHSLSLMFLFRSLITGPEISLSVFFLMSGGFSCSSLLLFSLQLHDFLCVFLLSLTAAQLFPAEPSSINMGS